MNLDALVSQIATKTGIDQKTVSIVVDAIEKIVQEHMGDAATGAAGAASGIEGALDKVGGLSGAADKVSGLMSLFKK